MSTEGRRRDEAEQAARDSYADAGRCCCTERCCAGQRTCTTCWYGEHDVCAARREQP